MCGCVLILGRVSLGACLDGWRNDIEVWYLGVWGACQVLWAFVSC